MRLSKGLLEQRFILLLSECGVNINGPEPWDIQVHDTRLYERVVREGTIGFGEAYMDGWWDCESIDEFVCRVLRSPAISEAIGQGWQLSTARLVARFFNLQSRSRALTVAEEHYNLDTELFQSTLDPNMQYTCGYWANADNLDDAQVAKMDLICRKLRLKQGMTMLDIGSGWGQLAAYAADNYGALATGITISEEQLRFCRENYGADNPEFVFSDYRDMTGEFDRITTVGMIEHVGYKNYREFMEIVHSLLADGGLFLLHTIGNPTSTTKGDPWMDKYIFPNGMLPSPQQIARATEGLFVVEDWHSFGHDYDKTLMAWFDNFERNWPKLQHRYNQRFYRMWKYYLLSCAGSFRSRRSMQLWQIVYSKNPQTSYISIR